MFRIVQLFRLWAIIHMFRIIHFFRILARLYFFEYKKYNNGFHIHMLKYFRIWSGIRGDIRLCKQLLSVINTAETKMWTFDSNIFAKFSPFSKIPQNVNQGCRWVSLTKKLGVKSLYTISLCSCHFWDKLFL